MSEIILSIAGFLTIAVILFMLNRKLASPYVAISLAPIITCFLIGKGAFVGEYILEYFCIGGILLGLGFSCTTTTMVGSIINKWCCESKGTIMGAVLAANGIGGAIAIQIITPVTETGVFGYRNACRLIAIKKKLKKQ